MSAFVDRAIESAGLGAVLRARRAGDLASVRRERERLAGVDLLALGALADLIRAEEVGDEVRLYTGGHRAEESEVIVVRPEEADGVKFGLGVLRRTALARVTGPRAGRVRLDWAEVGLELSQVALGFGATELAGPLSNRRGLPIAEDARVRQKGAGLVPLQMVKRRELAALVERAGRRPIFVEQALPAKKPSASELRHA